MHIPRTWTKVNAKGTLPDGQVVPVSVWGWGEDDASAQRTGADRLKRLLDRIHRGEPFPDSYDYGDRPVREEIIETIADASRREPVAVITRNSYGAEVLNTAHVLFLDVDFPESGFLGQIKRLFGGKSAEQKAVATLRNALQSYGKASFRLYRTASGLRAMAIDRDFDPTENTVQDLMRASGTDPAYSRLCRVQRSFRARLTPKPWRCNSSSPPGQHPRSESGSRARFDSWLSEYRRLSSNYATCRYLETIGKGHPIGDAKELVDRHDRATRCNESLPLA